MKKIYPANIGIDYQQKENSFDDFALQLLLPQKQSTFSSSIALGDVNNDGLKDFFVGNAKGVAAALFIQTKNGTFNNSNENLFKTEKEFEDTDAKFIDIDNDKDLDLFVTSGGYEIKDNSTYLQDRIYINDGTGNFKKGTLPNITTNTKGIAFTDTNKDGNLEIFVGGSVKHGQYPLSDKSYFLTYKNGEYNNVIDEKFDDISDLKIIKDALFSDYDNDGDDDLIVVGEWMPISIFENKNGKFYKKKTDGLTNTNGWFQSIKAADLDNDGNVDYIIGNWGENNKFHPTKEKPLHIYADYFDNNNSFDIVLSKVSKTGELLPVRGKECSNQQTPFINNKLKTFKEFANSTLPDIYGLEKLAKAHHFVTHSFASIILKNKGNGTLEIQKLSNFAQFSPTLGIEVADVNNDGYLDIFGIGNIYDAEVETIRYDASKGYLLLGSKEGEFHFSNDASYFNNNEAKDIKKILINGSLHFIILNKNNKLTVLKTNNDIQL